MKPFYVVAALAVLAGTHLNRAITDDAPAASGPSCEIPEPRNSMHLRPEVVAASAARFMNLCMETNVALVYAGDSRLVHNITIPGKLIGRGPDDFYPPAAKELGQHGTVSLSYVVEIDGRTSLSAILKSSGFHALDDAALKFVRNISYKSPAYLDSTPVRFYTIMRVEF